MTDTTHSPLVKASPTDQVSGLIERLEKTTGLDRELDREIAVAIYGHDRAGRLFTHSIDDALTLVPEGFKWRCGYGRLVPHNAVVVDYAERGLGSFVGECDSNRAIALCIAALKARSVA